MIVLLNILLFQWVIRIIMTTIHINDSPALITFSKHWYPVINIYNYLYSNRHNTGI